MKYLIAGASGQLAGSFIEYFNKNGIDYAAPPENVFDITSPEAVAKVVASETPDIILNCAAYNAVDAAENDPAPAYKINSDAVAILAEAANTCGARLVHYGTDYVFDGRTERPYIESDKTNPLNEYGKSKLAGENTALQSGTDALVLRVSWVYGNGKQNFLYKMRQWSEGKSVMKIVWDQISVPTYTEDIVSATVAAIDTGVHGLYHLTNSGYATRYEVARLFFKLIGRKDITVLPVGSDMFPSPVDRPFLSAMNNSKLSDAIGPIPDWEEALARFVNKMEF